MYVMTEKATGKTLSYVAVENGSTKEGLNLLIAAHKIVAKRFKVGLNKVNICKVTLKGIFEGKPVYIKAK